MAVTNDPTFIMNAIKAAVRDEIEKISAEEIAEAQKRVTERVRGVVDQMALSVMRNYEAYSDIHGVHIIVKKEI